MKNVPFFSDTITVVTNMVLPNTKTRYIPKTCKSEIFCAVKNNNSTTIHFLFLMFSDVARNDISPLLSHSKTNCT